MKILYGIPSEGMGHATRSKVIITHLIESGHDVRIATSDRAFDLMEKSFPGRCYRIEGFHLKYDQGTVDRSASFQHILQSAPQGLLTNVEQFLKLHQGDRPDVVISDFESFTYYFAKAHSLPLLSIDNMQVINRCDMGFQVPEEEDTNYRLAKGIIKAKVPFCNRYLVTSFFHAPPRKKNTTIIPPILRHSILDAKKLSEEPPASHITVYQTATSQADLIAGLQTLPQEKFLVYGFNREEDHGNVQLRKFSEDGFIRDLATGKAVITNGGFSLISEAVYLHRPICSFPLAGQFEQFVNGAQVEQMGYGRRFSTFHPDSVKSFLYDLGKFQNTISAYIQNGNVDTFAAVDAFLSEAAAGQFGMADMSTEDD